MTEFGNVAALQAAVGGAAAVSTWVVLDQARVNLFADATGDHQWIHVDPQRARAESPFGGPVAHGLLTLSLVPALLEKTVRIAHRVAVNYGLNRVRFPAPVPVGSRLRARFAVQRVDLVPGDSDGEGAQVIWDVTLERDGADKPVCVAELITRHYF
jgi:acyl dehydratase